MTSKRPRRNHSPAFKAKVALAAAKGEKTLRLDTEIKEHELVLEQLVRARAPALMEAPSVSTGTIADILVVLADNPQRIRSEAVFAKLCGVCPVPASSDKTNRHRLNRGVDRRRRRDPALSKANTCNLSESVGYEGVPIGADRDPGNVKVQRRFNSLAKIYRPPPFGADPHSR